MSRDLSELTEAELQRLEDELECRRQAREHIWNERARRILSSLGRTTAWTTNTRHPELSLTKVVPAYGHHNLTECDRARIGGASVTTDWFPKEETYIVTLRAAGERPDGQVTILLAALQTLGADDPKIRKALRISLKNLAKELREAAALLA